MNLNNGVLSTVGNTPLVQLQSPNKKIKILAKLEMMNPTASIKDRIAKYILVKAIQSGLINNKTQIFEGSSGNTGAAVAMISSTLELPCTIFVPNKTSSEKIDLIKSYGARIIICDDYEDYAQGAAIASKETKNSYFMNQYNNLLNLEAHYETTGKEIWQQTQGEIDYFVATGSTGGTICGVSKYLKEQNPNIKSILADPKGSIYYPYLKGNKDFIKEAKNYLVEGAGKHTLVDVFDRNLIDRVYQFTDAEAFRTALSIAKKEGIVAGGSSGGNVFIAYKLATSLDKPATIVTVLPDSGLKYLSKFYNKTWFKSYVVQ